MSSEINYSREGFSISGNADFGNGFGLGIENGRSGVSSSLTILGSQLGSVDRYGNYTANENFLGEINGKDIMDLIRSQQQRLNSADQENPNEGEEGPQGLVDLLFAGGALLMSGAVAWAAGGGSSVPSGGSSAGNGVNANVVGRRREDGEGSGEGGSGGGGESVGKPIKEDRDSTSQGTTEATPSMAVNATDKKIKNDEADNNIKPPKKESGFSIADLWPAGLTGGDPMVRKEEESNENQSLEIRNATENTNVSYNISRVDNQDHSFIKSTAPYNLYNLGLRANYDKTAESLLFKHRTLGLNGEYTIDYTKGVQDRTDLKLKIRSQTLEPARTILNKYEEIKNPIISGIKNEPRFWRTNSFYTNIGRATGALGVVGAGLTAVDFIKAKDKKEEGSAIVGRLAASYMGFKAGAALGSEIGGTVAATIAYNIPTNAGKRIAGMVGVSVGGTFAATGAILGGIYGEDYARRIYRENIEESK